MPSEPSPWQHGHHGVGPTARRTPTLAKVAEMKKQSLTNVHRYGEIIGADHSRKTTHTTDEDQWIKMSYSIKCFPAVICSSNSPLSTMLHSNEPLQHQMFIGDARTHTCTHAHMHGHTRHKHSLSVFVHRLHT